MKGSAAVCLLGTALYSSWPSADGKVFLHETFDDQSWKDRWALGDWKEADKLQGEFELSNGKYHNDDEADMSLRTTQDSRFYTAAREFEKFDTKDKTLVIQFQVKNEQNIECGGAYIKIGPKIDDLKKFTGQTPYAVMFGPDICGSVTRKTHVIFGYNGKNFDRKKDVEVKTDNYSHLYTFIVKPDNTYDIQIDMKSVASGNLLEDWALLPPKQIPDPEQSKPQDWVEESEIDDPEDKKPDDWVEESQIPDPSAKKPDDWDDEEDGEWTAPLITNPDYKGEWKPKRIPNPSYKGPWEHPMIDNPDYKDDDEVYRFEDLSMVGIDLWQVKAGTLFDNIVITDSEEEAKEIAVKYWKPLSEVEKKLKEADDAKKREEEEKQRKEAEAKVPEDDDDDSDDEVDIAAKAEAPIIDENDDEKDEL